MPIEFVLLDLASLQSVKSAADRIHQTTDRLDILILNAGVMALPPGKTKDGFEIQLGTNHVGHFLLTKLLLPLLQDTAQPSNSDVRIVVVTSDGYLFAPPIETILSTEDLYEAGSWTCYGASKAANIMFAKEFARRYQTITSVSVHPGPTQTDLYTVMPNLSFFSRFAYSVFGPFVFKSPKIGALNSLWSAAGTKMEDLVPGGFYVPVGRSRRNKWTDDDESSKRLWEWTEAELAKRGY